MGIPAKKGTCKNCGKETYLQSQIKKLCQPCSQKLKKPKEKSDPESIGERELHLILWQERPHNCTGCGTKLQESSDPNPSYFSHIIAKKLRPDLRTDPDNFVLECIQCHHKWDNGTLDEKYQLFNFDHKMEYIKNNDLRLYNSIVNKLDEYHGIKYEGGNSSLG